MKIDTPLFESIKIKIKESFILTNAGSSICRILVADVEVKRSSGFSDIGLIKKQVVTILEQSGYTVANEADWALFPRMGYNIIDNKVVFPFLEIV